MNKYIVSTCVVASLALCASAKTLEVSPDGLSPQVAVSIIRQAKSAGDASAWTVKVAAGRYFLPEPIVLKPEDSGTAAAPIRWIGEAGAEFSAGIPVLGWTDEGDGTWSAPIPCKTDGKRALIEQLWVNGRRAPRSPLPKKALFRPGHVTYTPVTNGTVVIWKEEFEITDEAVRNALAAADEEELLYSQFLIWRVFSYSSRVLRGYDAARGVAITHRPFPCQAWDYFELVGRKKEIILCQTENLKAGFTDPGEWRYDAKAGRVRYRPLAGETLATLDAVGSVGGRSRVLDIQGEPATGRFVEHVSFEGLSFAHTAVPLRWTCCEIDPKYTVPTDHALDGAPEGASQTYCHQVANGCDGVVTMNGARRVTFRRCAVTHTGNYAFDLPTGCWHNDILDCEMTDLGAGGVKLGEPVEKGRLKDDAPLYRGIIKAEQLPADGVAFNVISNCLIRDGGHRQAEGAGVAVLHASDTKVIHCEISHLLYSGISFGITWGYDGSVAQRNEAGFNHIHHLGGRIMSDLAGVYTLGTSFGTTIHDNVIHDITCAPKDADGNYGYGGWGIYHDEGSEGIVTERNLVYNTDDGLFFQHFGTRNIVRNNIFAWNDRESAIRVLSGVQHRNPKGADFVNNIVLVKNCRLVPEDPNAPDGWLYRLAGTWAANVWYDVGGKPDFGGLDFAGWKTRGRDVASVYADPKFVDAERFDFRLKPDSPAFALGFREWDFTQAGRR